MFYSPIRLDGSGEVEQERISLGDEEERPVEVASAEEGPPELKHMDHLLNGSKGLLEGDLEGDEGLTRVAGVEGLLEFMLRHLLTFRPLSPKMLPHEGLQGWRGERLEGAVGLIGVRGLAPIKEVHVPLEMSRVEGAPDQELSEKGGTPGRHNGHELKTWVRGRVRLEWDRVTVRIGVGARVRISKSGWG